MEIRNKSYTLLALSIALPLLLSACGGGSSEPSNKVDSFNNTLIEKNGVLSLSPTFAQEDIDSGADRVELKIGHSFEGLTPTTSNSKLSIESELKISLVGDSPDSSNIRNEIEILDGYDVFKMGLGINYSKESNKFSLTSYVERSNPGIDQYTRLYERVYEEELETNFFELDLQANKSYLFKLEYDLEAEKVYGYVDNAKIVQWNFLDVDRQHDSVRGPVNVNVFVQSRIIDYSSEDSTIVTGAAFGSEIDNLKIIYDGEEIINDNFNDGVVSPQDYNFVERLAWDYTRNPFDFASGFLTQSTWYMVDNNDDQCAGKIIFNDDDQGELSGYDDDGSFIKADFTYTTLGDFLTLYISSENNNIAQVDFEYYGYTSTNFLARALNENDTTSFFVDREDALDYAESLGINNCDESLPQ